MALSTLFFKLLSASADSIKAWQRLAMVIGSLWLAIALPGCGAKVPTVPEDQARIHINQDLDTWLAQPDIKKYVAQHKLAGQYDYVLVMRYDGTCETVFADDNQGGQRVTDQNKVTTLLRTFKTSLRQPKGQRTRVQRQIQL